MTKLTKSGFGSEQVHDAKLSAVASQVAAQPTLMAIAMRAAMERPDMLTMVCIVHCFNAVACTVFPCICRSSSINVE